MARNAISTRYWGVVAGAGALTMVIASSMSLLTSSKWRLLGTIAGGLFVLTGLIQLARGSAPR